MTDIIGDEAAGAPFRQTGEPEPITMVCAPYRRASDPHAEGSVIEQCTTCGGLVWLAPFGRRMLAQGATLTCLPCALPHLTAHASEVTWAPAEVTWETAEEVNRHLGTNYTAAQLQASLERVLAFPMDGKRALMGWTGD